MGHWYVQCNDFCVNRYNSELPLMYVVYCGCPTCFGMCPFVSICSVQCDDNLIFTTFRDWVNNDEYLDSMWTELFDVLYLCPFYLHTNRSKVFVRWFIFEDGTRWSRSTTCNTPMVLCFSMLFFYCLFGMMRIQIHSVLTDWVVDDE